MFMLAFESAVRSIIKTPGVSVLVILAIALGVGITMPMVTLYHNSGGDPLPSKSGKVYRVLVDNWFVDGTYYFRDPGMPTEILAARDARALAQSDVPDNVALSYGSYQYIGPAQADARLRPFYSEIRVTSSGFFSMFNLPIHFGSVWAEDADKAGQNVAVISHSANQRLFGGGDNVGKDIKVAGDIYTIVGILQPWSLTPRIYDLSQTNARPEAVYIPLSNFTRSKFMPNRWRSLEQSPPEQFNAEYVNGETIFAQLWVELDSTEKVATYRDFVDSYVAEQKTLGRLPRPANNRLYTAREWVYASPGNQGSQRLYGAFIVVGVVFLLVCLFNLLSLLLAKFIAVTPEACVMRALGASRSLIFLQYVTEVIILGAIGGLLSIAVAKAALKGMFWVYIQNLPDAFKQVQTLDPNDSTYIQLDTQLLLFTFALAIAASLVSALLPAWRSCRIPPADHLKMN